MANRLAQARRAAIQWITDNGQATYSHALDKLWRGCEWNSKKAHQEQGIYTDDWYAVWDEVDSYVRYHWNPS